MINELRMKNFKQHTDTTIKFGEGLNIIVGDNGAGKTSTLRGILYALFGTSAVGAKDHLKTWGESGPMFVELTLTLPNKETVVVTRGLNKATVKYYNSENITASGQSAVNKFLEEALGMSGKVLRNLLCAEQGKSQGLIDMGASNLQLQLEGIARAEIIDQVMSLISTDCTELNGELKGIGEISDLSVLAKQKEETADLSTLREGRYKSVNANVQDLQSLVQKHSDKLNRLLIPEKNKRNILTSKKEQLVKELSEAQNELTTKKVDNIDTKEARQHISNMQEQIAALYLKIREGVSHNAQVQADLNILEQLQEKLTDFENKAPVFEELLYDSKQTEDLFTELCEKESQLKELEQELKDSVCPTCDRAFNTEGKKAAQERFSTKQLQVKELRGKYSEERSKLKQKIAHINTSIRVVKAFSQDFTSVQLRLEEKEREVKGREFVALEVKEEALDLLRGEVHALITLVEVAESMSREEEKLTHKINNCKVEITSIDLELQTIDTNLDEQIKTCTEICEDNSFELQKQREDLDDCLRELNIAREKEYLAEAAYNQEQEKQHRHQSATDDLHQRTSLQKFLRKNRGKLIQESWDSLTQYASYLVNLTTEGLMTNLTRSDKGLFYIEERGRTVPVEELSGARKSIIGLCLRVALTKLFYGDNGFTLFDEVTADCTEENAARVAGLLQSLKSQVIMVTHRESDAMNANVLIQL